MKAFNYLLLMIVVVVGCLVLLTTPFIDEARFIFAAGLIIFVLLMHIDIRSDDERQDTTRHPD